MFTSVLIGVDGRQGGRDAIALARQLAAPAATLTLGHVCAPILGRGAVEALPGQRAEARKLLARERGRAAVDARSPSATRFRSAPGCTSSPSSRRPTSSWSALRGMRSLAVSYLATTVARRSTERRARSRSPLADTRWGNCQMLWIWQ